MGFDDLPRDREPEPRPFPLGRKERIEHACADVLRDPPAPIRYNFDAGYPAPEALPREPLGALATTVLTDPAALGYVSMRYDAAGEPIYHEEDFNGRAEMALGNTELRTELAGWVGRRQGIESLDAGNFILTSGASQAIALAAAAFINPLIASLAP